MMKLYKKQKQFQQILMKKNITCKTQNLYVLLDFLLIIIGLIAVSIYHYLLKRWAKQNHLLPFQATNKKLR